VTIFFPDISGYQTGFPLTGIPAVIVKATEGIGYVNPDYQRVASEARSRGILQVAYHYLHAGNVYTQAALLRQVAGDVPAMIDAESVAVGLVARAVIEAHPGLSASDETHVRSAIRHALHLHGPDHPVVGSMVAAHLDHPPVARPAAEALRGALSSSSPSVADILGFASALRSQGGTVHLVYLPRWYWQALGSPDLTPLERAGLHVISSNYTTYSDSGPGWAGYGGVSPVIWQFTDAYHLNGFDVDMNAYPGTVAELTALVNGGSEDDMDAEQARMLYNLDRLNTALLLGQDTVTKVKGQDGKYNDYPLQLVKDVADLKARPALSLSADQIAAISVQLAAAVVDDHDRLTDADLPLLERASEAALRTVLGAVDGATPQA
jgi:hypothetical protein